MSTTKHIFFSLIFALVLPVRAQNASELSAEGLRLMEKARYAEAERLFKEVLQKTGPGNATALYNLASVYHREGKFAEAAKMHGAALEIIRREQGETGVAVAQSLSDLGAVYGSMGEQRRAVVCLERAAGMLEGGGDVGLLVTVLNNLGTAYYEAGRKMAAEAVLRRGLSLAEPAGSGARETIPYLWSGLGRSYLDQKKYGEAEVAFERAVREMERERGAEHPDYAVALQNLATVYQRQKRFREAQPLMARAVSILEQHTRPGSAALMASLQNYAEILKGMGRSAEAKVVAQRAKEMTRAAIR